MEADRQSTESGESGERSGGGWATEERACKVRGAVEHLVHENERMESGKYHLELEILVVEVELCSKDPRKLITLFVYFA